MPTGSAVGRRGSSKSQLSKASNLIASGSLTFDGHWKQGSSSILPSEQEQVSNWTFKISKNGRL
jgi:hypothetical protein